MKNSKLCFLALVAAAAMTSQVHAAWTFGGTSVGNITQDNAADITSLSGYYVTNGASNIGFGGNNWTGTSLASSSGALRIGTDSEQQPQHALDNNGRTEAILFGFDESVVLSGIGLSWTQHGTSIGAAVDASVFRWVGDANANLAAVAPGTIAGGAMAGWELVGNYGDLDNVTSTSASSQLINTSGLGSSWWLISAYNSGFASGSSSELVGQVTNGNDYFKIKALGGYKCTSTEAGVCAPVTSTPDGVPEPASLALVMLGLAGVVGSRRRILRSVAKR